MISVLQFEDTLSMPRLKSKHDFIRKNTSIEDINAFHLSNTETEIPPAHPNTKRNKRKRKKTTTTNETGAAATSK